MGDGLLKLRLKFDALNTREKNTRETTIILSA